MQGSADARAPGLRERKKERTREMIRAHAMRLFRTQGYEATTVQQIIDEIEIDLPQRENPIARRHDPKVHALVARLMDRLGIDQIADQIGEQPGGG